MIDRKITLTELVLRCLICCLAIVSAVLIGTDSQVRDIFSIKKRAKFTDMKALVFLVIADGLAAAYSLLQASRCAVMMMRGGSVMLNKPFAWLIFSGDQAMSYLNLAAVSASAQAAAFSKFGQDQLQWMKTCELYGRFCNQVGVGIASSVLVGVCMILLSAMSAFSLFRLYNKLQVGKKYNISSGNKISKKLSFINQ